MLRALSTVAFALVFSEYAFAQTVQVSFSGEVDQNQVTTGELGTVNPGDPVTMSFEVDSTVFTNSPSFPTRGYPIDQSSFSMVLGGASVALQNPFPGTPYFVLRDNDPAVDGFFVSRSFDFPIGVPIDEVGIFGNFVDNYSVTYTGNTLSSLSVLDAIGTYAFGGLTVFNWTIDDGAFNPVLIDFQQMTISLSTGGTPASTTFRNGTGINPPCMTSMTPPIIGTNWQIHVDTTPFPGAAFTVIQARQLPDPGRIFGFGEVLIALASPLIFSLEGPVVGGQTLNTAPIPNDPSLAGFMLTIQPGVIGGGSILGLCNAEDVVVGTF